MTRSFSNLPRKGIRFLFLVSLILAVAFVVLTAAAQAILRSHINHIQAHLAQQFDVCCSVRGVSIDWFGRIRLDAIAATTKTGEPLFTIAGAVLQFDIPRAIWQRQIRCREVALNHITVGATDIDLDLIVFSLVHLKDLGVYARSTKFALKDIVMPDVAIFDMTGYLVFAPDDLVVTRGEIVIDSLLSSERFHARVQSEDASRSIGYVIEAAYRDHELALRRCEFTGYDQAHCLLTGSIKNYDSKPQLFLEAQIDQVPLLVVPCSFDMVKLQAGLIDAHATIRGDFRAPTINLTMDIHGGMAEVAGSIPLTDVEGKLAWQYPSFELTGRGKMGGAPFTTHVSMAKAAEAAHVKASVSIERIDIFDQVDLGFEGYYRSRSLEGNCTFDLMVETGEHADTTLVKLGGLYIDFDTRQLLSDVLDVLIKRQQMIDTQGSKSTAQAYRFRAHNCNATFAFDKTNVNIHLHSMQAYQGTVCGDAGVARTKDLFAYHSAMHLEGFELASFFDDVANLSYRVTGTLSGDITTQRGVKESIAGEFEMLDGSIRDNVILHRVAGFFDLPSLDSIYYTKMQIALHREWDAYRLELNVFSPQIWLYFDNRYVEGEAMDGYLLARIPTEAMEQSRFKQLFRYIDYTEPMVYFPFKVVGYSYNPRIEWLRSEFKEKITDFLPDKNMKIFQEELNRIAADFKLE